jgi:hypothetical protein
MLRISYDETPLQVACLLTSKEWTADFQNVRFGFMVMIPGNKSVT